MSDAKILKSIMDGDERVFDHVITKYSKLLWHVVSGVLISGDCRDIEECVADVFIYLWKNPDKFDPEKSSLKSWLCMIAKSRALNKLRDISKHSSLSLEESVLTESFEIEGMILDRESAEIIIAAVKSLKEPDREIFIRRYCYEEKISKIAEELNLSEKSVENHLYRTKLKLRKLAAI